jgi:hypothetical protein
MNAPLAQINTYIGRFPQHYYGNSRYNDRYNGYHHNAQFDFYFHLFSPCSSIFILYSINEKKSRRIEIK